MIAPSHLAVKPASWPPGAIAQFVELLPLWMGRLEPLLQPTAVRAPDKSASPTGVNSPSQTKDIEVHVEWPRCVPMETVRLCSELSLN